MRRCGLHIAMAASRVAYRDDPDADQLRQHRGCDDQGYAGEVADECVAQPAGEGEFEGADGGEGRARAACGGKNRQPDQDQQSERGCAKVYGHRPMRIVPLRPSRGKWCDSSLLSVSTSPVGRRIARLRACLLGGVPPKRVSTRVTGGPPESSGIRPRATLARFRLARSRRSWHSARAWRVGFALLRRVLLRLPRGIAGGRWRWSPGRDTYWRITRSCCGAVRPTANAC